MQNSKLTQIRSCLLLAVMALTMMSFTVVIDAGHGGHDAGAIGLKMKVQEKNLNLAVAKQLAAKIREKYPEVKVVLTRDTDVFLPLQQRADIANKNHADLFISIHTNASSNPDASGTEAFAYVQPSRAFSLGEDIVQGIVNVTGLRNRGMKVRPGLYVLRRTAMPAVLVELGFITNPGDAALMNENPRLFAQGIYQGIENYFSG